MTKAKEFIEKVEGMEIENVQLLEGNEDMEAGGCQFEFELENGYRFVG